VKRRRRDHGLAALLFTDIVDSTRIVSELGDRRWRALLSRHHSIMRAELKRFRGREVDTAGDGFFAVFDEPSDALRCAAAVSNRLRNLGVEVRAGLNFGEAETIGGKPGGIAVHAAARIMGLAGAGEVLVSSTVRDLVPGSGFAFEDRGTVALRSVPGEWRIFALTAIDGAARQPPLSEEEATARLRAIEPPPLYQRRSGRAAIGAIALGVVVAAIWIPIAALKQPRPPLAAKPVDHVDQIDPANGRVVRSIPVGNDPTAIAFGEGSIWVTNSLDGTVSRIYLPSGRVATIPVGQSPDSIVVGPGGSGAVWVANALDGTLSRIDPLTNRVVATVELGLGVGANTVKLATDDETSTVWVSTGLTEQVPSGLNSFTVGWIDETSNSFVKVFRGGCCYGAALAAGSGSVWFASSNGTVVRFDAATRHVVKSWKLGIAFSEASVGNGAVWLASASLSGNGLVGKSGGEITPISLATNQLGHSIPVGGGPTAVAVSGPGVFVSNVPGGIVPYIGGSVAPTWSVGGSATSIVAGEGLLWATVDEP
jgi:class 3 adenylate cyclase